MRRDVRGSVVVVTGATSGVGRATAHAFASAGARLVVVARDPAALADVIAECERRGAAAVAAPADIADPAAVDGIVETALEHFGRIDTWVCAAATLLAAHLGDESTDEVERVLATNVLGTTLCARAAVRRFRVQGDGVLVLVSSMLARVPNPLVPVYVSSKFAIRGLALSLHADRDLPSRVRVCCVQPGPIDTPMFERAANHTGHELRAIPPASSPDRVAGVIVACARRPRREAVVGWTGRAIALGHRVLPRPTEWAVARASAALLTRPEHVRDTTGGLRGWDGPAHTHGGWRRNRARAAMGDAAGRWSARLHTTLLD